MSSVEIKFKLCGLEKCIIWFLYSPNQWQAGLAVHNGPKHFSDLSPISAFCGWDKLLKLSMSFRKVSSKQKDAEQNLNSEVPSWVGLRWSVLLCLDDTYFMSWKEEPLKTYLLTYSLNASCCHKQITSACHDISDVVIGIFLFSSFGTSLSH